MAEQPSHRPGCGCVVFVVGVVMSALLMLPLAMSVDPCGQGDTAFRCTSAGQHLLPALPWLALLAGLILTAIGTMLGRRWAIAPRAGLFGAAAIYVVVVVLALGSAESDAQPPTPQQIDADYATLTQRPDAATMLARYQTVITDVKTQLGPAVQWSATQNNGALGCAPDFPGISSLDDGEALEWSLTAYTTGTVTDTNGWRQAVAALTGYLAQHGFTQQDDTSYRDFYGTVLRLDSTSPIALDLTSGCFLSAAAKQRGTPPTGP